MEGDKSGEPPIGDVEAAVECRRGLPCVDVFLAAEEDP